MFKSKPSSLSLLSDNYEEFLAARPKTPANTVNVVTPVVHTPLLSTADDGICVVPSSGQMPNKTYDTLILGKGTKPVTSKVERATTICTAGRIVAASLGGNFVPTQSPGMETERSFTSVKDHTFRMALWLLAPTPKTIYPFGESPAPIRLPSPLKVTTTETNVDISCVPDDDGVLHFTAPDDMQFPVRVEALLML